MNLDLGYRITLNSPEEKSPFQRLYDIFQELVTHTSGDVEEAIDWLRELDKEYELTTEEYTIDDFINDLLEKEWCAKSLKMIPQMEILLQKLLKS
jgi:hypothetical protein